MNAVQKLIAMAAKYGTTTNTEIWTNVEGEKYQYQDIKGPKNTPVYLKKAFEAAATEAAGKYYEMRFNAEGYSFFFDRNPFKGGLHGSIYIRKLIVF